MVRSYSCRHCSVPTAQIHVTFARTRQAIARFEEYAGDYACVEHSRDFKRSLGTIHDHVRVNREKEQWIRSKIQTLISEPRLLGKRIECGIKLRLDSLCYLGPR